MPRGSRLRLRALALGAAAATVAAVTVPAAIAAPPTDTTALRDAVTAEGVMEHERTLQSIADANDGTRASGTSGFDASADYVTDRLQDAGYTVTRQPFDYEVFLEDADPVLEQVTPDPTAYAEGDDFSTMEYSGSGDTTAALTPVDVVLPPGAADNTSNSGCEEADFAGFPAGNIALVQRGTCDFRVKVTNAATAGATGVVIFNEGQEGRTEVISGTLGAEQGQAAIPAVGTSFAVGQDLFDLTQTDEVTMHLAVTAHTEVRSTENVIAETNGGRGDRVTMLGAHLDSVQEGPGIHDNGSGSAGILEIAEEMAESGVTPRNKVRFAWWGAEESGLVGSQHYVDQLSARAAKDIAVYLNFDMIGSPNYVRFVYDGDGSAFGVKGPSGSANIEKVFTDFFAGQEMASEPTQFDGRSDYDAFVNRGIAAGGLFTGAEDAKSAAQAAEYGGVAGAAFDPCYHQACDSLDPVGDGADAGVYAALAADYDMEGNVNLTALEEMTDAAAHAALTFAMSSSSPSGTEKGSSTPSSTTLEFRGNHQVR
ncbi:MAG: M20/M25/M40 family metallo-hydrolase [Actinomycetes bacterium]